MAVKIYIRPTSGTDADYVLHSTEANGDSPELIGGLDESTSYTFKLIREEGGVSSTPVIRTATTNAAGFVDVPDTFPTPLNSMFVNVYGNSLIAAAGDDGAQNIQTRLAPLLNTSGKTVYTTVTGNNGMPIYDHPGFNGMLNLAYMQNFVYSKYYLNSADVKILVITEWVNELDWVLYDHPEYTVAQAGQALLDGIIEVSQKARNIDNWNTDFTKPGGAPADPGDGYRVGIIIPVDCARTDYRPVFDWVVNELKATYRQYANFLVDASDIPYLMPNAAGTEGSTAPTMYYRDGTHHTELGENIYTNAIWRDTFDYLSLTIPTDISGLTASLSSGTVTASATSGAALEYRIKEGSGAFSAWQGHGTFTGITNPVYTVEARMIVKPSASLSYTAGGGGSVTYEAETTAHISTVEGVGGTVPNKPFLNDFILNAKSNSILSQIAWAGGTVTGYKDSTTTPAVYGIGLSITSGQLYPPSDTRKPDLITNSLGRPVFYFEGQDTFSVNDVLFGAFDNGGASDTLTYGVKDLTLIALGKLANRTTANGQALMTFGGYGEFGVGTDAAGNYIALRAGNSNASGPGGAFAVTATTPNTGGNVLLCATFKADTKVLDIWINGVKENSITIADTIYPITSRSLFIGAANHAMPTLGNHEFGVLIGARPSDSVISNALNFILTNLPNS